MSVDDIKKAMRKKKKKTKVLSTKDYLSTGSTLLNLACSGRIDGGFAKGLYTLLVGDSSSGKTFLSLTCLAEATLNPEFKDYRFIFDNAENGALMDVAKFFGQELADRLEPPAGTKEDPVYSSTVEEFYYHTDDACKDGTPFIYVLDSMDALDTQEEEEHFQERKNAHRKGKSVSGTYGTSKAKRNSSGLRTLTNNLRKSGSILIVVSQTRDNIGFDARFNPKTRSGGRALRFFCRLEFWSSIAERIKRRVRGSDRQVGIISKVKIVKNHISGWEGNIEVPIYRSTGIDDIGGCVRYLVEEKHWKENSGVINAAEFDFKGSQEDLVSKIEEEELEQDLKLLVQEVWEDIESKCTIKRKSRYGQDIREEVDE